MRSRWPSACSPPRACAKWKALRSLTRSDFRGLLRAMRLGRKQQKGTPRCRISSFATGAPCRSSTAAVTPSSTRRSPQTIRRGPLQAGPNRLQDELVRHVNEDEQMSEFAFALQFLEPGTMTHDGRTQEASFWVENAAVEWNERESPFHVVGGCGCCRSRCCRRPRRKPSRSTSPSTRRRTRGRSAASTAPAGTPSRRAGPLVSRNLSRPRAWTPGQTRPEIRRTALGVAALVFVAALGWAIWPVTRDLPRADQLTYPSTPLGSNGLTAEERQQHYHLSEGGEAYPIAWLLALEQEIAWLDGTRHVSAVPRERRALRIPAGSAEQLQPLRASGRRDGRLRQDHRAADDGPELHGLPRRRAALQRPRVPHGRRPSMAYINAFVKGIVKSK